ncbi:hypothetical protein ASG90_11375 [Nocardioides sp. Soil797]|nr:hypothetical protein ASG90_11375 [Nocardioides sp. Soil797]
MRSGSRTSPAHSPRLRRSILRVVALSVLVLPVGLLVPAHASAEGPGSVSAPVAPDDDQSRSESATKALDVAEATLKGEGTVDATLALVQVQQTVNDLPIADRRRAERLLARPTDDDNRPSEISYDGVEPESFCTDHFCIHWLTEGKHAPRLDDSDDDSIPDYVETTASTMEQVWATEIETLGYRRPVSDGKKGNPAGQSATGLVDVYLGNTGSQQVYGYAVPEDDTSTSTSYLVLDNDFAEFPGRATDSLKVTAAHEFFHAAQFAYSTMGDRWFMEATATWAEEQVYDAINDNRQFLPGSTAVRPGKPLDNAVTPYANWVFFESLSERHGPTVMRAAWNEIAGGRNSMMALNKALTARGSSLATDFSRFAGGSNVPGKFFAEGAHYRRSAIARSFELGAPHDTTGTRTFRQQHMSSRNFAFKPKARARAGARITVRVETAAPRVRARLLVAFKDDTVKQRTITFNRSGVGRATVAFAHADVTRVVLTVSNTSFRYRCFKATTLTCQGTARDDNTAISYRATVRRG